MVKSAGGIELDSANLPDIVANGCGFWSVVTQDGTQFVWQGGGTEGVDASEFFADEPMAAIPTVPTGLDDPEDEEDDPETAVEVEVEVEEDGPC